MAAFHLWVEGWSKYKPSPRDAGREMVLQGHLIRRDKIPEYFTEYNKAAFQIWNKYRIFGLPYSGGWAEQPARLMDIIAVLETEARKREAEDGKRKS